MKRRILLLCTIIFIFANLSAHWDYLPKLTGPYLGQKPPGMTPEIFAPGIISKTGSQSKLFFTSDGYEAVYSEREPVSDKIYFLWVKTVNGVWSEPTTLLFSQEYINMEPCLSADGSKLFFASNRPKEKGRKPEKNPDIWMVEKGEDGWGEPRNIGASVNTENIEVQPYYTLDRKLYFLRQSGNIRNGCFSQFENGQFSEPVLLDENIFNKKISGICISPDNKILVVHSNKLDGYGYWDLYVSFIDKEGNWTKLINMGNVINTDQKETNATFSPDGKYLFFTRGEDIYWVSTKIIDELKKN